MKVASTQRDRSFRTLHNMDRQTDRSGGAAVVEYGSNITTRPEDSLKDGHEAAPARTLLPGKARSTKVSW